MWKQKIGISIGNHYSVDTKEVIKIIKEIGFDAISPVWEKDIELKSIIDFARKNGLEIQSLHAPFDKVADMWSNKREIYTSAKNELFQALEVCKRFDIKLMVVHAWIGFEYQFDESKINFQNFDELITEAEKSGVKIAFENTEGEEYLFAILEHFKNSPWVGFCWDSGHELCYNHSQDLLSRYGDRLMITHLNDNLGISRFDGKTFWTDDLHLLPYDGVSDWKQNIERLKKSNKLNILNFELNIHSKPNRHENDIYSQMGIVDYFAEAYKRACRIAYIYSK